MTAETGLEPCSVRRLEIDKDGKIIHKSNWAYNGWGESSTYKWDTLKEGLTFVLDRVSGVASVFKKYGADLCIDNYFMPEEGAAADSTLPSERDLG